VSGYQEVDGRLKRSQSLALRTTQKDMRLKASGGIEMVKNRGVWGKRN